MRALVDALVRGMPAAAVAAIIAQAQGNPLFAVETVRLADRPDVVLPGRGRVPARRGDHRRSSRCRTACTRCSLPVSTRSTRDVRTLVADAAVLGTSFPAEALVAVSAADERPCAPASPNWSAARCSTCPPTRCRPSGAVRVRAEHAAPGRLRNAVAARPQRPAPGRRRAPARSFTREGDEVMDVIAQHYLDALAAVPDDPDTAGLREQAISALMRAAERAERTGAPGSAASSYASAARLRSVGPPHSADAPRTRPTSAARSRAPRQRPGPPRPQKDGPVRERCGSSRRPRRAPAPTGPQPSTTRIVPARTTSGRAWSGRPPGPGRQRGKRSATGAGSAKPGTSSTPRWRSWGQTWTPTRWKLWSNSH